MTNAEMVAGRFARWNDARKRLAWINARLSEGRTVVLFTYLRAYKLTPKRPGELRATKTGLYLRSGKSFLCMDGCALRTI